MQQIKISNSHDTAVIEIEGTIGIPEEWQFEQPQERVATYEKFRQTLQDIESINASRIVVNIRSTGGDVNDALLIYDALTSLDAAITTRCWGYVASAATVIAQAASDGLREISPNALYLVHNSTCSVEGNASELASRVELLKKSDERLAELYARRSGGQTETFAELMAEEGGAGRWLNASETIEYGLADAIIESARIETTEETEATEVSEVTEATESEEKESTIDNALSSVKAMFRRLGRSLGNNNTETDMPIVDKRPISITHNDAIKTAERLSTIAFEQQQQELKPTKLAAYEDPSLIEVSRTANQSAYDHDANRMRRSR